MLFSYSVYQSEVVFDIISKPDEVHYYPTFIRGISNPETGYVDFYLGEVGGNGDVELVLEGKTLDTEVVFQNCLHTYLAMATQYLEKYLIQCGEEARACTEQDFCKYVYTKVHKYLTQDELTEVVALLNTSTPSAVLDNLMGDTLVKLEKGFGSIELFIMDTINPQTGVPYYNLYYCEHVGMHWQSYDTVVMDMKDMPTNYVDLVDYMERHLEQFCEDRRIDYTPYTK